MNNEDRLREMADDAAFYGRQATGDGFYDEHHEYDSQYSLSQDEWLKLKGMTQEEYDRQCDELHAAQRESDAEWHRR